jgi:hypothetical protein
MRLLERLRPRQEVPVADPAEKSTAAEDKETGVVAQSLPAETDAASDEVSLKAQRGVQRIEAITKHWDKKALVLAYVL